MAMSLLWAVAPVAVTVAVVVVLTQLRAMEAASLGLSQELRRLGEVSAAVAAVRSESADARARLRSVRLR